MIKEMFEFVVRTRLKFSRRLLDWAEALPNFQGGPISLLQLTRKYQRENAKSAQEYTKPPDGVELDFIGFRMFEVYQTEAYDSLEERILTLFPNLREDFNRNELTEIRNLVEEYGEDSWSSIGVIAREKSIWAFQFVSINPALPETIDYITIGIHKALPSVDNSYI